MEDHTHMASRRFYRRDGTLVYQVRLTVVHMHFEIWLHRWRQSKMDGALHGLRFNVFG